MNPLRKIIGILVGALAATVLGCEKGSTTLVSVPNVDIDCQISACDGSVSAATVFVLLSKSGCQNDFDQIASATPGLTCGGSGCGAIATSWIDSSGDGVDEIFTGDYSLCLLIDNDNSGNGSYTTGDIVYEDDLYINSGATLSASGFGWRVVN